MLTDSDCQHVLTSTPAADIFDGGGKVDGIRHGNIVAAAPTSTAV